MAWFKKQTLKVSDSPPIQVPDSIDLLVKDIDFAVVSLNLALRPLRRFDAFETKTRESLELCLKIMATTSIILRTKYCREAWEPSED